MMNVSPKAIPVFINAALRSPVGKFGGALRSVSAARLAAQTLAMGIKKYNHDCPDFVIMGHARQAGCGPNPARQAAIFAGLQDSIPAWTINHACASGLSAAIQGFDKIKLSRAKNLWVGGVESMSNTPYLLTSARWGHKLGHQKVLDAMYTDGFFCPMADMVMGETVERFIAKAQNISRLDQDRWAHQSHQRAALAWKNNAFAEEVVPVEIKGKLLLSRDESIREDSSLEALAKLAPVFGENNGESSLGVVGSITAGNSSAITDGAAWLWISSEETADSLCEIVDYDVSALDPKLMGLGPVSSIQKLLQKNGVKVSELASIEINEAFAAQILACQKALGIDPEKLNPLGGAIALGHPIGSSGARILVTLAHQLKNNEGALGVASLCVSGGQGVSILVKGVLRK